MPFVPTQELGKYVEPDLATVMYTPEQHKLEQEAKEKKDIGGDALMVAGMERDNVIASYQAKNMNRPSVATKEESEAFASGAFNVFDEGVVPDEHKKNPAYMKEYATYGTNQRMVDWVSENIGRQEKNAQMLDDNTVAGMGASFVATMLSPEQWPSLVVPAGLMLKGSSTVAKMSLTKVVAYEAGIAGASAVVGESLLHETQPVRTKEESMYAVGGSILFSSLLVGGIGIAQGRSFKILKNLDDEMATIDSHPNVSSVGPIQPRSTGAMEADVPLPKELETAAINKVDNDIAEGKVNAADRDAALQSERKMLSETLSEVKHPKTMRVMGYIHPEVRIATSQMHSARVAGEQLITSTVSRLRHQYGESLGDAVETTMSQFKYQNSQLIADVLDDHYTRFIEEIKKTGGKKLTYPEFSELVGKANRADDASDIIEVAAAAKQLRSKLSKPIESRLVEQNLIDSYYSGFEKLTREDLADLVPEEDLGKFFDGDAPLGDINKLLDTEVMDELNRMGKLAKEAKIPKGDASYFHRQWDFGKIDADPQGFLNDVKTALRGESVKGMEESENILQKRIDKLEQTVEGPPVDARSAAERSTSKLEKDEAIKKATEISDEVKADVDEAITARELARNNLADAKTDEIIFNNQYEVLVKEKPVTKEAKAAHKKKLTVVRKKLNTSRQKIADRIIKQDEAKAKLDLAKSDVVEARAKLIEAKKLSKVSPEQRLADMKADLVDLKIEHARYIDKNLDDDLVRVATEIKNAIEGGTLTPSYRIKSLQAGPLKDRSFAPPSKTVDKWLVNDADSVWNDYVEKIAPDLHMKERFGSVDFKDELETVGRDYDVAIQKATNKKEAIKLTKEKKQTIRDLEAMLDSIHGRYGMPNNPNGFLSKSFQRLREINFMTFLGQMTVSAIPDVGHIIMRHGLRDFTKSLTKVAGMSQGMKMSMKQLRAMGVAIDLTNNTRLDLLAQLDNKSTFASRGDRFMNKATNKFSRFTGMQHWNAAWKQVTGFTYSNNIIDDAMKLSKGKLDKKKITAYARGGLSKSDMQKIAGEMDVQKNNQMDGVWLPDTDEWADQGLAQRFKSALIKEVENTIVTPTMGDLPLVSRGEVGRLIFQFKSFAMTANNKIIMATLDDMSAQKMVGLLSMVMLGGVSQIVRDATKGKTTDLTSEKGIKNFIDNAIDRSGALAYYGDINGMAEKATRGKAHIIPKLGGEPLSRYASRNMLGSMLGVSAGRVADIGQMTGAISAGEWRESDARAARRFIGFNNLFWTHRIFNKLEEAAGGKQYGPLGQEK